MQITKEIESIHQENLKRLRTKWICLLIFSQIIWCLVFLLFNNQAVQAPEKHLAALPAVHLDYIRLELPLKLYFPIKDKLQKILIHHQGKKTLLANALLYRKSSFKENHYLVDIPKRSLKKLLPLPENPLEAYPDKSEQKKIIKRKSYEIVY